jgi:hypothetical protein
VKRSVLIHSLGVGLIGSVSGVVLAVTGDISSTTAVALVIGSLGLGTTSGAALTVPSA